MENKKTQSKYAISITYKNENDRDLSRVALMNIAKDKKETLDIVLDRILKGIQDIDPKLFHIGVSKRKDIVNVINSLIPNDDKTLYDYSTILPKVFDALEVSSKELDVHGMLTSSMFKILTRDFLNKGLDYGLLTEKLISNVDIRKTIRVHGIEDETVVIDSDNKLFDYGTDLDSCIDRLRNELNSREYSLMQVWHRINDSIRRYVACNPKLAVMLYLGQLDNINIDIVITPKEKEYRGILGRIFKLKSRELTHRMVNTTDYTVIVSFEQQA
ncbi:MAG: hypothetical protein ACRCX8_10190 [Sarcina sp.]